MLRTLLLIAFAVHTVQAADAAHGKELFAKRCSGCHDLDRNKEGPRLRGVYGRVAGKVDSFNYSDGMKGAKFTWDENKLNRWLTNPDDVVQDNDMAFHLEDGEERAAIIAFLKSLSNP